MKGKAYFMKLILFFIFGGITFAIGTIIGWWTTKKRLKIVINKTKDSQQKLFEFYQVLIRWMSLSQRNIHISSWLGKKGIKTIAIYGMKELGELLYEELKQSDINVCYGIDKDSDNIVSELTILNPNDELDKVDAVIVTAIHYYDEIEKALKEKGVEAPIYSLEDILYEMENTR